MPKPLPPLDSDWLLPPVSPLLYRYFEHAEAHPFEPHAPEDSLRNAWWLAECALAAYADEALATEIFALGGLGIAPGGAIHGPASGGQVYVVADEAKVIVAFRGTEVIKGAHLTSAAAFTAQVKNVLQDVGTDLKALRVPWSGRSGGTVHRGFAASLEELLPPVKACLAALHAMQPDRPVWLTGHSLGAALATLAADRLERVQGVHTFGSPQVGDATFVENYRPRGVRFRNHADVVAWLPSSGLGYEHISGGRYFNRNRELGDEPGALGLFVDWGLGADDYILRSLKSLVQGNFSSLAPEALNDHAPVHYAILTWNAYEASL